MRLPSLGFHFSPARYHRLMQVVKIFQAEDGDTADIQRPWDQADFEGWLSILSWKVTCSSFFNANLSVISLEAVNSYLPSTYCIFSNCGRVWEVGKLYGSAGISALWGLFFTYLKNLGLDHIKIISGATPFFDLCVTLCDKEFLNSNIN